MTLFQTFTLSFSNCGIRCVAAAGFPVAPSKVAAKCVHIVNLASVRELERTQGRPVDPLRFRANVYLEGVEPWAELGWIGKEIGLGEATLAVFARTRRCEATNVDPARGVRDMAVPAHLQRTWGH